MKNNGIKEIDKEKGVIIHCIPTPKGVGGAPIISVIGTKLKIIGIAKGTVRENENNQFTVKHIGRLIDPEMLALFDS